MHVILPSDDEPMKVSFDVPRTGFKKKKNNNKYTLSETTNTRLGRVSMSNLCRGNRPICDLYGNLQQDCYFNS